MTLASLASAGAPLAEVSRSLERLDVDFEIEAETVEVSGVRALRVTVEHPEQHVCRTFRDIRRMIEAADLPERSAERAIAAFRLLAEAEGSVHGRPFTRSGRSTR
jgi:uncharacterized protein (DUF111 family)